MNEEVTILLTHEECLAVLSAIGWLNHCFDETNTDIHRALQEASQIPLSEITEVKFKRDWRGPGHTP